MKRMGRMLLLASSSLAILSCQGCVGTALPAEHEAAARQSSEVVAVSEGMRLASRGMMAADVSLATARTPGMAAPLRAKAASPVGPPSAGSSALTSEETLTPLHLTAGTPPPQADIFSDIAWSGTEGLRGFEASRNAVRLQQPTDRDKNFAAQFSIDAPREQTGLAFDVGLVPSIAYTEEGEFQTRSFGAELRFGRDFDQRGTGTVADSWYIFAGTEGEALVWEAGEYGFSNVTGAVALRDQITVGDMQAGVSFQRGEGQLSFSYIRREVEWGDRNGSVSENEDFAGVSFTLKR